MSFGHSGSEPGGQLARDVSPACGALYFSPQTQNGLAGEGKPYERTLPLCSPLASRQPDVLLDPISQTACVLSTAS